MESIKDKVAIVGMGCTKFGELWDKSAGDLVVDAAYEAMHDAGVGPEDLHAAWVGCMERTTGAIITQPLQLQYLPVTRVENACATGVEAIRAAVFGLLSKAYDLVLVVGVEKLKDIGYAGLPVSVRTQPWHPVYSVQLSAPGFYAMAATRYFHRYGLSREEGKRLLAKISVKSHHNGARNPRAHLQREVTEEQVMSAPMVAWPLGLYDCCGVTDGAAAAVLCRTEDAKNFRDDYITIKGIEISTGPGQGKIRMDYDWTHWEETARAAHAVYQQAGVKNPRKELDMVELHDCFSIAELIAIESLGISEYGKAKHDIESGTFTQEGDIPVNLSGGLKSFGHPIGASGCREMYEIYKQIQGKAENPSRQLKNVRMGLVHNQGGHPGMFMCGVAILGQP